MRPRNSISDDAINPGDLVRIGTIADVDLTAARVVVELGDIRSGPIRWLAGRSGETRSWAPPSMGEQVLLLCPGGDIEAAVAVGALPQKAFPPAGDSSRQLIEFSDVAVLAYDPDGHTLEALLPAGATASVAASGGVTLDVGKGVLNIIGDVCVNGKITATGDLLSEGNVSLAHHKHKLVKAGTDQSGEPA